MTDREVHEPSGRRGAEREGWMRGLRLNASGEPKYLTIANALAASVERGELAPGDRLPPQRRVAEALGVERTPLPRKTISSARPRAATDQRTAA